VRPSQAQDRQRLAALDRAWAEAAAPSTTKYWRNVAALAFLVFCIGVALKDVKLLAMVLLAFAPLYGVLGWFYWLSQNPPKRDWINYWVVECDGKIQACAKWEHYDAYSLLQQLYVVPKWRLHGLGRLLLECLVNQANQPIYVVSDRQHRVFFTHFGFVPLTWDDLPANFPMPELTMPQVERSAVAEIPMLLHPQLSTMTSLVLHSDQDIQIWSDIEPKIYIRSVHIHLKHRKG
jgi:N-acetylglutamate synthase-like GNAT family acetyltransferase